MQHNSHNRVINNRNIHQLKFLFIFSYIHQINFSLDCHIYCVQASKKRINYFFYLPQKVYDISRSDDVQKNPLTPRVNKMKKTSPNMVTYFDRYRTERFVWGKEEQKISIVILSHMSSGNTQLFCQVLCNLN